MAYNDDEDEPLSTRRALERADHRKSERKEASQKKKVEQQKSLEKLKRDMLQKQVHGSVMLHKDTSTPKTFGPKSVEEKASEQYQSKALQGTSPEELMDNEEVKKQDEQETKQEQQSGSAD
jgi:hypothetical protein